MLSDVLAAYARTRRFSAVYVVAENDEVGPEAERHGAALVRETRNRGYNEAIATALDHALAKGAHAVVITPSDVPAVTPGELDALASPARDTPMRMVASRDGGTNGLYMSPPGAIATQFGPLSASRHRSGAVQAGIRCEDLVLPGLALDIDTPDDLRRLLDLFELSGTAAGTRTCAFLRGHVMAGRLSRTQADVT